MAEHEYLSIPELARLMGLTRVAVYQRVKKGQIKAVRIGRNYAIPRDEAEKHLKEVIVKKGLTEEDKAGIQKAVQKAVKDYGEVLKRLGDE